MDGDWPAPSLGGSEQQISPTLRNGCLFENIKKLNTNISSVMFFLRVRILFFYFYFFLYFFYSSVVVQLYLLLIED